MLSRYSMKLETELALSVQKSSLFHGAMMERLSQNYASFLHESKLHPYSQHLEYREGSWYWIVNCLNKESKEQIIDNTLTNLPEIELQKYGAKIRILSGELKTLSYKDFSHQFYMQDSSRYIMIHFVTPTSFKQRGQYLIYPDLHCIYQSLMSKYEAATEPGSMMDEETLEQLEKDTRIIQYDLKSTSFSLEGVRIPSYIGKIKLKLGGTQTLANFANMLFQFGSYSGVGIKSSIGMGAFHILEERKG